MPDYVVSIPVTANSILNSIRDIFLNQTTDGSGNINLTLSRTPTSINNISVFIGNAGYLSYATNLVGTTLTVIVRKTQYDRTDTATPSAENLPSGVTKQTTKQSTDSATAGGQGEGTQAQGIGTHSHGVSFEYAHTHSYTSTDLPIAATQAGLNFSVIYN
jgi:hypothetical protein